MPKPKIKVFLVDDSLIALTVLKRILAVSPEIEIVGTAMDAKTALIAIPIHKPDVICTDFHMADMDGLELTKQIMATYPRPILVISTSVQPNDPYNIFQLLEAGAIDVFAKPVSGTTADYELIKTALIDKVKLLAGVAVFKKRQPPLISNVSSGSLGSTLTQASSSPRLVAIGASTGGPQALQTILTQLPHNFPIPVICVQHISEGFLSGLVSWLSTDCALKVQIAPLGGVPLPGNIYFPPERMHLELDLQGKFKFSAAPPVDGHRPSVTTTFQSVASFYGKSAIAILLTGMGRDGAEGMRAVSQAGGLTIAQDEKTSLVFGMPKEAIALGAAQSILPLEQIAPLLLSKVSLL